MRCTIWLFFTIYFQSFAILTRDELYNRSLYSDEIGKELNLNIFCVIDDRKNFLILRTNENKRSGMALFTQIWKLDIVLAKFVEGPWPL